MGASAGGRRGLGRRHLGPLVLLIATLAITPSGAIAAFGPPLVGHWTFDQRSSAVVADASGGHELRLVGGASLGPGVVGAHSLSLRGHGQFAAAAGPVVDTARSFTVCAWVDLANANGFQTFVSQDGKTISGFYLQLLGTSHRFAFARVAADSVSSHGTIDT